MKCAICKNEQFELIANKLRDSNEHKVVKCTNCQLTQLSPLPSIEDDKKFYDENRQSRNRGELADIEVIRRNSFYDTMRRVDFVSRFTFQDSMIIDVGSGYGFFIDEMDKRGFNIIGVEISKERREISKRITDAQLLDTNICESPLKIQEADCITLFHVLEHIIDPIKFLKTLRTSLKKDGKLIIEVPNLDDLLLEYNRSYADFYWQRAHLFYFSKDRLIEIMNKAGFTKYKIYFEQRYGIENFMNWNTFKKPQIDKPSHRTNSNYKWLEDFYKSYLIDSERADTLIIVASK